MFKLIHSLAYLIFLFIKQIKLRTPVIKAYRINAVFTAFTCEGATAAGKS